jgi:hypothetical protein
MKEKQAVAVTGTGELVDEAMRSYQRTASRKRGFTRNLPAQRPETHRKATGNDVRDLPCMEKKGDKIRPVDTISRDVMRHHLLKQETFELMAEVGMR